MEEILLTFLIHMKELIRQIVRKQAACDNSSSCCLELFVEHIDHVGKMSVS